MALLSRRINSSRAAASMQASRSSRSAGHWPHSGCFGTQAASVRTAAMVLGLPPTAATGLLDDGSPALPASEGVARRR